MHFHTVALNDLNENITHNRHRVTMIADNDYYICPNNALNICAMNIIEADHLARMARWSLRCLAESRDSEPCQVGLTACVCGTEVGCLRPVGSEG